MTLREREAQIALVKGYWGTEECAGFFVELFGGSQSIKEDIRRYLRAACTRDHAAEFLSQIYEEDVTDDARKIRCPTLILHRYSDRAIPYGMAEQLHQLIPGSELKDVQGLSHLPWVGTKDDSMQIAELTISFLNQHLATSIDPQLATRQLGS